MEMPLAQLYLSPNGRATRSDYWLKYYLPYFLISILSVGFDFALGTHNEEYGLGLFSGLTSVLMIYPSVMVSIKRLHDRGRTGWFYLLMFVPLVNLWPTIEILFLRGTHGPNKYGPDAMEEPYFESYS